MSKRIMVLMLALMLMGVGSIPAFAADGVIEVPGNSTSAEVTADIVPMTFSVTVPTELFVALNEHGETVSIGDAKITNNSNGSVKVSKVEVSGAADPKWTLLPFGTAFTGADAQEFKMVINNSRVVVTGENAGIITGSDLANNFKVLKPSEALDLTFALTIPKQTSDLGANAKIATVTFTLNWADNK